MTKYTDRESFQKALNNGFRFFRDTFGSANNKLDLTDLLHSDARLTFEECYFKGEINFSRSQFRSMTFRNCIFEPLANLADPADPADLKAHGTEETISSLCVSLDLTAVELGDLHVRLIPWRGVNIPWHGKNGDEKPCLHICMNRARVNGNAYFEMTTEVGTTEVRTHWLGGTKYGKELLDAWGEADTTFGKAIQASKADDSPARWGFPALLISAEKTRIARDLDIVVPCDSAIYKLKGVSLVAPDLDSHGWVSIAGVSSQSEPEDRQFLFVACNLERANVRERLRLFGTQLAVRRRVSAKVKSQNTSNGQTAEQVSGASSQKTPALRLTQARIDALEFLDFKYHDTREVPRKDLKEFPHAVGTDPLPLPFKPNSAAYIANGVLDGARLNGAVLEFAVPKKKWPGGTTAAIAVREFWEDIAKSDSPDQLRSLILIQRAMEASGSRSATDELEVSVVNAQTARSLKYLKALLELRPDLPLLAILVTLAMLHLPRLLSSGWLGIWQHLCPLDPSSCTSHNPATGLKVIVGVLTLAFFGILIVVIVYAVRKRKPREAAFPKQKKFAHFLQWLAVILYAIGLASAFLPSHFHSSDRLGVVNYLAISALMPFLAMVILSESGRQFIRIFFEATTRISTQFLASNGRRPLSVVGSIFLLWLAMSGLYFLAMGSGFMAPEELETYHLETEFQQAEKLRLHLDGCAGVPCGHDAADAKAMADMYFGQDVKAMADIHFRQINDNAKGQQLAYIKGEQLALIPISAIFHACRINWARPTYIGGKVWKESIEKHAGAANGQITRIFSDNEVANYCARFLPAEYSAFQPFIYAADVVVPLLNLRQEEEWSIRVVDPESGNDIVLAYIFLVLEVLGTLIGWLCALILAGVITGLSGADRRAR